MKSSFAAGLVAASLAAAAPLNCNQTSVSNATVPAGFVQVKGDQFVLDGKPFFYAGTNAYFLPFFSNESDIVDTFTSAKAAGLKVIRTWAYSDRNATFDPNGLPQYAATGDPTIQTFYPNGTTSIDLTPLDRVVAQAEAHDSKLIMTLTNNWADYGGADVYTLNNGGQYHDDFYTHPRIIAAFKRYVSAVVTRYRHSASIFAWELINEPRCGADAVRNLPRSANCTPATTDKWFDELSTYIKSLDPHHLVTTGGEGQFNRPEVADTFYNGTDGEDFEAALALPNIDFGTIHTYPDWWTKTVEWANQWIIDHADAAKAIGKPVIHEEYGWLLPEQRLEYTGRVAAANETRVNVLSIWQNTSLSLGMSDMYWQFGRNYSGGRNYNDGFTIYLEDAEAQPLVYEHAAKVNAASDALSA